MLRTALAVVTLCSIALVAAGCTSTRNLNPERHAGKLAALEKGDQIILTRTDGARVALSVVSADDRQVVGTDGRGVQRTHEWADVADIEITEFSPARTALAAGGAAAAVYLVVAAITAVGVAAIFAGAN